MALAIVSVIAFVVLMIWRFVFAGSHCGPQAKAIAPQQQRLNLRLEEVLHILDPESVAVVINNQFENNLGSPDLLDHKDRAKRYLQRIAALTGATQMSNSYVLDVGKTRFRVHHRYIIRLRDRTDPGCALEETCFYLAYKDMPKAEEIATALLQLMSNPALFDRWAAQSGAFKADGQAFSPEQ